MIYGTASLPVAGKYVTYGSPVGVCQASRHDHGVLVGNDIPPVPIIIGMADRTETILSKPVMSVCMPPPWGF